MTASRFVAVFKVFAVVFAVGAVGTAVLAFLAAMTTVIAHDDQRCPFHPFGAATMFEGVRIEEQARVCDRRLEEHRWLVVRAGQAPKEVGRRRLPRSLFAPPGFSWSARREGNGVLVEVRAPGIPTVYLRELDG